MNTVEDFSDRYRILWWIMCTFVAQIFERKIRVCIIHGYNDYIPWV